MVNGNRYQLFLPEGVTPALPERLVRRFFGLDAAATTIANLTAGGSAEEFLDRAMVHFGYGALVQNPSASLACVPSHGGLLAVANHPSGPLDGLLALHQLRQVRTDVLVLGNQFLQQIVPLQGWLIPTVESRNRHAARRVRALLKVRRHLCSGGCVLAFPAGTVAHFHWPSLRQCDAPWSPILFEVCARQAIPVLPIRLNLKNRLPYHLLAALSRSARTSFLLREMLHHRRVANPIEFFPPLPRNLTSESLLQTAYQATSEPRRSSLAQALSRMAHGGIGPRK